MVKKIWCVFMLHSVQSATVSVSKAMAAQIHTNMLIREKCLSCRPADDEGSVNTSEPDKLLMLAPTEHINTV